MSTAEIILSILYIMQLVYFLSKYYELKSIQYKNKITLITGKSTESYRFDIININKK